MKRKAFSSADIGVEVWDQASGQNLVLQVENQFFNLALSQQEVLTTGIRILRIKYYLREGLNQWIDKG